MGCGSIPTEVLHGCNTSRKVTSDAHPFPVWGSFHIGDNVDMSQVNEIKMSVPVTLAAIPVQFDNIQRIGALAGTSLREITGGTYKIALLLLEKNNQLPAANEVFDYLRGPTAGTATWIAQSPAGFLRMALGGREENAKEMSDALGWIQGRNYGAEVTGVLHIEAFY